MKPNQQVLQSSQNPPSMQFNPALEEIKKENKNGHAHAQGFFQNLRPQSADDFELNDYEDDHYGGNNSYKRTNPNFYNFNESYKKYSNLYAIDGFASLADEQPYTKTYQDHIDVNNLVDIFGTNKSYNIDKMFQHNETNSPNPFKQPKQPHLINQASHTSTQLPPSTILCEDFFDYNNQPDNHEYLSKLFEDPNEKQQKIQQSIQQSRQRKRMRINSGSSNQSKKREPSIEPEEHMQNKDLLKAFDQKLKQKCQPTIESVHQMLQGPDLVQKMMKAMESAKKNMKVEDPQRLLTRLAFDFMSELMSQSEYGTMKVQQENNESQMKNINQQLEQLQVLSRKTFSDQMSMSQNTNDYNSKSMGSNQQMSKRRYNAWNQDEEKILMDALKEKQMKINEFNEQDWKDMENKLSLNQSQIFWKAKRMLKCEEKQYQQQTDIQQAQMQLKQQKQQNLLKISKKDIVTQVLSNLPNQRGTKKQIFKQLEQQFNLDISDKQSSLYKSFEQALSKYFYKIPQIYSLNQEIKHSPSIQQFQYDQGTLTMKNMLIYSLLCLPLNKGSIKQIKSIMIRRFQNKLLTDKKEDQTFNADSNLHQWEKTILKTIHRHKNIFLKEKAVYQLQERQNEDSVQHYDEDLNEESHQKSSEDQRTSQMAQRISPFQNNFIKFKKNYSNLHIDQFFHKYELLSECLLIMLFP